MKAYCKNCCSEWSKYGCKVVLSKYSGAVLKKYEDDDDFGNIYDLRKNKNLLGECKAYKSKWYKFWIK